MPELGSALRSARRSRRKVAVVLLLAGIASCGLLAIPSSGASPKSASSSSRAAVPAYRIKRVTVHAGGIDCDQISVTGLLDHGPYVGNTECGNETHAFLSLPKQPKEILDVKGADETVATDISNHNVVTLWTENQAGTSVKSYLRTTTGHLRRVSDPKAGSGGTTALGVNEHGEIVGTYFTGKTASGSQRSFVDIKGKFKDFKVLGAEKTLIAAVNNGGTLVGTFVDHQGGYHGFIARRGTVYILNVRGAGSGKGQGTELTGVSNNLALSGNLIGPHGHSVGFIRRHNKISTLAIDDEPTATGCVNDSGQACISVTPDSSTIHGYIGTPKR